ncbi:MAG: hypothetical protein DMG08_03895 [Acidobacteria bacterium]|nr:MAG: hypothetical protein DMG08_03895 [Acidobacteriota bacterium]PYV02412.1 MAG: hypothetical protein DMG10_14715 [Acidobacteriota bacterium]
MNEILGGNFILQSLRFRFSPRLRVWMVAFRNFRGLKHGGEGAQIEMSIQAERRTVFLKPDGRRSAIEIQ